MSKLTQSTLLYGKEYVRKNLESNYFMSEDEAISKLKSFSSDKLITSPAVDDFHRRMALGEKVDDAFRGAWEYMIRRAG